MSRDADREAPVRVAVTVHPDALLDPARLSDALARRVGRKALAAAEVRIVRRAIDARRGRVRVHVEADLVPPGSAMASPQPVDLPALAGAPEVAIVGAGPAGMFCAWALARQGIRAVVLERGRPVRGRRRDLAQLTREGTLDPDSNYCYGEGGAGTFSDGKLYTRSSKRGPVRTVMETFVAYGAPPDVLVDARPHIGTNKLPGVITRMREHLTSAGVELMFETRAEGLQTAGGRVTGVRLADGRVLDCRAVVVAPGHSARDVHRWVHAAGGAIELKPFAVGLRIEHPQAFVDRCQFGDLAGHPALGAASYRLVEQVGGVGVFSFCMCPGGFICPAATEPDGQVVNGWSPSSRRGKYANSGLVTEVGPAQLARAGLDPADPFAGTAYQRRLEREAYVAGGGAFVAPAQRLDDFVAGRPSSELPPCSYRRGLASVRLDALLGPLAAPLREALRRIDAKLPGFAGPQAVAVALESRTSAPVRLVRDRDTGQSPTLAGLFPCGEGAGFAGGIMSAALDGLDVAHKVGAWLRRSVA